MSQKLVLDLSDEVYCAIKQEADQDGAPPARWLAAYLERRYGGQGAVHGRAAAQKVAGGRLELHLGAVDVPGAVGLDNERLDAELAAQYGGQGEAD